MSNLDLPLEMSLDPRTGDFVRFGISMGLTPGERLIFVRLLENLGKLVSVHDLRATKEPAFSANSIRVMIHRLRPAIESAGFSIFPIKPMGYIMRDRHVSGNQS